MKENKKVMPSGIGSPYCAATKSKFERRLAFLSVLFCMLMLSSNAWAGQGITYGIGDYKSRLRVVTEDTGKGLVYCAQSNSAPSDSHQSIDKYKEESLTAYQKIGFNGDEENGSTVELGKTVASNTYGWAMPLRGYLFYKWVGKDYDNTTAGDNLDRAFASQYATSTYKYKDKNGDLIVDTLSWDGKADLLPICPWMGRDASNRDVTETAQAKWKPDDKYIVRYKPVSGGVYTVTYQYVALKETAGVYGLESKEEVLTLDISQGTDYQKPYGATATDHENGYSYAADAVTLSTSATNFVGWYENGEPISTDPSYSYAITKTADVEAKFKWIDPVAPEEKHIRTTDNSADVNESVVFRMENRIDEWAKEDFSVTLVGATGSGTFSLVDYSYDGTSDELTVNYTYNANGNWEEGSSVTIQVAPANASYGTSAAVLVKAIAQENSANQARVSGEGFATQEGDLTDMLIEANKHTDATLTLLQDVAVSSPLVVSKSMTLDLNNWKLSSTAANKIISVEGTDTKLTIEDNSFLCGPEIQLTRSANAAIAAIEVTGANRLLYKQGKMTVVNNAVFASNANAKAYGIYVSGTGNAVMQGGSIKVESDHDARGVFIASGNATLNVGAIEATAKSQAYALYSGGKINVAEGITLTATTTTGSDASALYLTGGTAVVDNVTMSATSAANNAFGANVQGGKLTLNGGTISATAATPCVYGVYIAAAGNATIQQQANITAELTTAAAGSAEAQAFGILNLGTVRSINSNVTAISLKNYATAVDSRTSATSTTIEGGTYTAQSATGYAYGLHHQYGTLSVDGGTFSATAAGDNVYGARAGVDGAIANATLSGETTGSGKTVYGFVGGVANKNITLTNCTIKAKSATSNAYAIFSRANVTATGCELEAKTLNGATACGFYAENGTNAVNNTNATVESYTTEAYGVNFTAGSLTLNGGSYTIIAKQSKDKAEDSKAYGVYVANGKEATIKNAEFSVLAINNSYSQKAYGAYTGTGTITSTGCTYEVNAAKQVYGICGGSSSTLNLKDNVLAATSNTLEAYGIYSNGNFTINGDKSTSETGSYTSYPLFFGASAHGEVLAGKFMARGQSGSSAQIVAPVNKDASASNVSIKGGFFYDISNVRYYVPEGYDIYGVDPSAPEYAEKYYYRVNDQLPYENVCHITEANRGFPTLAEAFDYARDHNGNFTIVMTQPYTLPAGNYTLPANATLLVPYNGTQTAAQGTNVHTTTSVKMIAENRLLIFESGVNMDVNGKIEVSADVFIAQSGSLGYVQGPYGRIHMEEGSTVTLNNNAVIYAWGYITGSGEIRVKNGATVYEDFQIHDMPIIGSLKDNFLTSINKNKYNVFPVNQYYIQSIEAPTKYYYGSKLYGKMGYMATTNNIGVSPIKLVGLDALFNVTSNDESSWVCKKYNPATDRIIWETNSSAQLGSLSIPMSYMNIDYSMESIDFNLPITNNMSVHVLSGSLELIQSAVIFPDAEIIIDKTATLVINQKDSKNHDIALYLYDQTEYGSYAAGSYVKPVKYSPSWNNGTCPRVTSNKNSMRDASIYVKGKIEVNGEIYTTASGAAIYSDPENAGTIDFKATAPELGEDSLYAANNGGSVLTDTTMTTSYRRWVTSAKLRNGGVNGSSFTETAGIAEDGDTYAYMDLDEDGNFQWENLRTVDECVIQNKTTNTYYAKPQGYVAITSDTEDANHLFHSVAGERTFLNMPTDAGCQWWEVTTTLTDDVYYCATNGTYYHWVPDMVQVEPGVWEDQGSWEEYKVNVTFYLNEAKTQTKVLEVNYGAKPDASIVSNPTKGADDAATYTFYGWKSSKTGTTYAYTAELESVTEDMYYLPIFTPTPKKYTITFADANNGANVYKEVAYGSNPSCDPIKDPTAQYTYYFLNWTDASSNTYALDDELPAVTGAATYTAHWAQVVNKYTIIWKNGEEVLQTDTKQPFGTATAFTGTLPTKEMDDNFVYTFSGWRSSLTGTTYENGSTPAVEGETTYEAQFSTTSRYMITFANYDGTQLQKEAVTTDEHPVYNGLTPGRTRDYDGYYRFTGWKNSEGEPFEPNDVLPAVTAKETYTAQYDYVTELYLITLNNVNGNGASWAGKFGVGSTPFYDPNNDDIADMPTKAGNAQYSYPFTGWTPALEPVSGEATYTAQFGQEINSYTITFANLDGNGASQEVVVEYGQTPVCPVGIDEIKKVVDHTTYAFIGWNTAIVPVSGEAIYTAQFSSTGTVETFPITFDLDNGSDPVVMNVAYNTLPVIENPTKDPDEAFTYMFNRWEPAIVKATDPATYTAQYTQTLNKYTVRFVNYDDTELLSSELAYGTTPTYSGETPKKPLDEANAKAYTFSGWSPAIGSVTGNVTYMAQYNEVALVATVTTAEGDVNGYSSWTDAYSNRENNCTIKLYKDVTGLSAAQALDKPGLTLDLNGHTISGTCTTNRGIVSATAANITITDSSEGKTGTISGTGNGNGAVYTLLINGGSLTIDYANVSVQNTRTRSTSNAYGVYVYNGSVVINNGKFKATSSYSSGTKSAVYIRNNYGTATIKGGYYSNSVTPATGYQCVTTSEISGYTHKVIPVAYTITLNKGTRGRANGSATVDFAATELKTFTPVTAAGYDCSGYFDGELQVLNAEGTFAAENVSGYITGGKWSKAANSTLTAKWNLSSILEANNNDNIPVSEDAVVDQIIIHDGGEVNIDAGVELTATDLIIESTSNTSGQLVAEGNENINVTGNAYFDWTMNGTTGSVRRTWYAVAVPWEVNAETGILDKATERTMVAGRDFDLIYYSGADRAANGNVASNWQYVQWDIQGHDRQGNPRPVDNLLHPGRLYMMYFAAEGLKTVRFVKADGAAVMYTNPIAVETYTAGDPKDANWNGIANPRTYYATIDVGNTYAQVLNNGNLDDYFAGESNPVYQTINLASSSFMVGKPLFVQAVNATPVVINKSDDANIVAAYAPRRARAAQVDKALPEGIETVYELTIAAEGKPSSDNLFVQIAEEDKEDRYVIGLDLTKGGMAAKRAQMWVNRYNAKLSVNTQSFVNDEVTYPLGIYAPVAGEYTIALDERLTTNDNGPDLYLTLNGEAIWNLSNGDYTLSLPQGNTADYGLRISARKSPSVATGVDEAVVDAQGEIKKVIINDQVFIIRGDQVYSIDGQLVK